VPELQRVSITIEPGLLARLDAPIAAAGHQNRSEAVRDLIRAGLARGGPDEAVVAGSLTRVYDHDQCALVDRLVVRAYDHHGPVLSTLHVHPDAHRRLEVTALRGPRGERRHHAAHALGMKGVLHGELVLTDAG